MCVRPCKRERESRWDVPNSGEGTYWPDRASALEIAQRGAFARSVMTRDCPE